MTLGFRHEALLYEGREGFLAGAVPYVQAGLDAGEPVLVASSAARLNALRSRFGSAIEYADMAVLGRNPARIIPAWQEFIDRHDGPARGIGEPVWRGRGGAELVECQLHEALLNVAFDQRPFSLLCPYDRALAPAVLREARCSHPRVDGAASPLFRTKDALSPFDAPLAPPPATARILGFEAQGLGEVRRLVEECGGGADLVLAINELAANSIRHGGGRGVLRVWRDNGSLICEIKDRGRLADPLAGRRAPAREALDGRGLWIANQVCDLVQVRSGSQGTTVRARITAPLSTT